MSHAASPATLRDAERGTARAVSDSGCVRSREYPNAHASSTGWHIHGRWHGRHRPIPSHLALSKGDVATNDARLHSFTSRRHRRHSPIASRRKRTTPRLCNACSPAARSFAHALPSPEGDRRVAAGWRVDASRPKARIRGSVGGRPREVVRKAAALGGGRRDRGGVEAGVARAVARRCAQPAAAVRRRPIPGKARVRVMVDGLVGPPPEGKRAVPAGRRK